MAIQGRALRRGSQHRTDVTAGLSRLYAAGFNGNGPSRRGSGYSPRRRPWVAVAGAIVTVAVGAAVIVTRVNWTKLEVSGIEQHQELGRKDLADVSLRVWTSGPAAGDVRIELNGTGIPATPAKKGDAVVARRKDLVAAIKPGRNALVVSLDGKMMLGGEKIERTFSYDPSGPMLLVPDAVFDPGDSELVTIRGLVDGASSLTAEGVPIAIEPGGMFTVDVPLAVTEMKLVAVDKNGNPERRTVAVTKDPAPVDYPATAAVHVKADAWADPLIRQQIVDLAAAGRINAVELDIKDEGGEVGYTSEVPLASKIGAVGGYYDAEEAVQQLHDLDVRVIGRIVCFLDPAMAKWAVENDRDDLLVLDGSGTAPLANNYGTAAFTNLASPEVRDYQMDLAEEAVSHGFDEILYDYVRRPEGDLSTMTFEGLDGPPTASVTRFVAETARRLEGTDAKLGVSVFGIASTRPEQVAQDIQLLAPQVDYLAPMVYPSHWGRGEFGVDDPVRQPGDIVAASVADFERLATGSGAAVVPWLQDFDSGDVTYGAPKVRAQIDAARFAGAEGFLLWNAYSQYTADALSGSDD